MRSERNGVSNAYPSASFHLVSPEPKPDSQVSCPSASHRNRGNNPKFAQQSLPRFSPLCPCFLHLRLLSWRIPFRIEGGSKSRRIRGNRWLFGIGSRGGGRLFLVLVCFHFCHQLIFLDRKTGRGGMRIKRKKLTHQVRCSEARS